MAKSRSWGKNDRVFSTFIKSGGMKIHEIKIYQEFDAPIEQVWEAFNDHANFGKMMGQKIRRVVDSTDPGNINGLGSVRSLSLPLVPFEETIVKSEKPTLIEYKISKGAPLHHHHGRMHFKSLPDGRSAIDYSIELGSKIPAIGGIVKAALNKGIADGLRNYAKRLKK
jgi:uncharacterized membrane protein